MAVLMMVERVELADDAGEYFLRAHGPLRVCRAGVELVPRVEKPGEVHELGYQALRGELREHAVVLTDGQEHVEEGWGS